MIRRQISLTAIAALFVIVSVARAADWPPQPPDDGHHDWVTFVTVEAVQDCSTLTSSTLPPAPHAKPAWTGTLHLGHIACFPSGTVDSSEILAAIRNLSPDFVLTGKPEAADLLVLPTVGGQHNGALVALELVKHGFARATATAPESFVKAEDEARQERRGAWATNAKPSVKTCLASE